MIDTIMMPLVLCFLRVSAFVAFLPPFGGQNVPNTVKVGLVVALTAFWIPSVLDTAAANAQSSASNGVQVAASDVGGMTLATATVRHPDRSWLLWIWLGCREIMLGLGMSWLLGTILIPLRIAGSWLAEEIGLNIASVTSAVDTGSGNVMAVMFEAVGVLLLYTLNIHHGFLLLFDRSFRDYQVGRVWELPSMANLIRMMTTLPEKGLAIAAPMGVVFLLILVVLLYAMKQSPQFNLMTFGMPFRLLAGLLAMILMFPDVLANMTWHIQGFLTQPK